MARIGLIAHDEKKDDLVALATGHRDLLARHALWATGTTGTRIGAATGPCVTLLKSGPPGRDAQSGAMIAEARLDALIFFQNPLSALPHDVKALTRLATLYGILFAMNRRTAEAILSGP